MSLNGLESRRAFRRVHSNRPSTDEVKSRERLVVIREITAHAKARAASLLEDGEASTNDLVLSDDEDDDEESNHPAVKTAAHASYRWSPDDVLCLPCFSTVFSELYYAWWLEERQTDRVEGELVLCRRRVC